MIVLFCIGSLSASDSPGISLDVICYGNDGEGLNACEEESEAGETPEPEPIVGTFLLANKTNINDKLAESKSYILVILIYDVMGGGADALNFAKLQASKVVFVSTRGMGSFQARKFSQIVSHVRNGSIRNPRIIQELFKARNEKAMREAVVASDPESLVLLDYIVFSGSVSFQRILYARAILYDPDMTSGMRPNDFQANYTLLPNSALEVGALSGVQWMDVAVAFPLSFNIDFYGNNWTIDSGDEDVVLIPKSLVQGKLSLVLAPPKDSPVGPYTVLQACESNIYGVNISLQYDLVIGKLPSAKQLEDPKWTVKFEGDWASVQDGIEIILEADDPSLIVYDGDVPSNINVKKVSIADRNGGTSSGGGEQPEPEKESKGLSTGAIIGIVAAVVVVAVVVVVVVVVFRKKKSQVGAEP